MAKRDVDGYELLANAIIVQATKDYRSAYRRKLKFPHDRSAQGAMERIERFFRSGWYEMLTSLDGDMILQKVREMEEYEYANGRGRAAEDA